MGEQFHPSIAPVSTISEKFEKRLAQASATEYIDILNEYAWELSRIQTEKSKQLAEVALEKSTTSAYEKGIADAETTLAQCYWLVGSYSTAIDHLEKALKIYSDHNNKKGLAETMNLFGGIYSRMAKYDKAKVYFSESLEIRRGLNDNEGAARSLNSIGDTYMKLKDYHKALDMFVEALAIPHDNEMYKGILRYNLAESNFHLEDYDSAYKYINECLIIGKDLNFPLMIIYCESLAAKIEIKRNDLVKAEALLTSALGLARSINNEERSYNILKDLSTVYEQQENYKQSLQTYKAFQEQKEKVLNKQSVERLKAVEHQVELEQAKSETDRERLKNIELEQAYHTIQENRNRIAEQNKEITDSIKYAKRIQEAIYPSPELIERLFPESFVLYNPKDVLSGDFYWVSGATTSYEEKFAMAAVVDCTGHGIPGALMSIIGNNFLRICERESTVNRPSEALDFINKGVSRTLRQEYQESAIRDGMDMVFIAIEFAKQKLHFAGAKNPLYIIRDKELFEYKGDKQPIGGFVGDQLKPFTNHTIDIQEGDLIYMFSDGYADQFGGPKGKKFLYKRFKNLLVEISHLPMTEQKTILEERFDEWKGNLEQIDDVCVMGIRI